MQSLPLSVTQAVFEAAPDAMVIIDTSGTIRYANRQVLALFDRQSDGIVGQNVEQLLPVRSRNGQLLQRLQYTRNLGAHAMSVGIESRGQRRDGTEFPMEIRPSSAEDADGRFVVAAIRDVSDRERVERNLTMTRTEAEQTRVATDHAKQATSERLAAANSDLHRQLRLLARLNGTLRSYVSDPEACAIVCHQQQTIVALSQLVAVLVDGRELELPATTHARATGLQLYTPVGERPLHRSHLLLVENHASLRTAAKLLLEVENYRVTAVGSGAEAIQAASEHDEIDLVVTAEYLGHNETGLEVINALRERHNKRLPAVLLTGNTCAFGSTLATVPDLELARKPIDAEELFTLIDALLLDSREVSDGIITAMRLQLNEHGAW